MSEGQNIEYKENWRDEYLKWICGFANANGGRIYIGRDDNGKVVGLKDYKRLMEDIPNKIHDILGIVADVALKSKGKLRFIEITVSACSVPISYKGRYYYRTGSVKRELTGNSLNEFLLKKAGKTWDDVIEPRAKFSDIDKEAVRIFLESAARAKRFPVNKNVSIKELFSKLKLTEKGKLKRAALVLFAKDPGGFFATMYIQIGRFRKSKVNLLFQEVVEGNLIKSLEETLNVLDRKFLISPVSFEGIHRIEKWQYPLPALREIILNILVHRNYMGAHTQIAIYDDNISFWNEGGLPAGWTIKDILKKHDSMPRNPIIANVCFLGGYIDAWGRGIEKIVTACKKENFPAPEFDDSRGFRVTLYSTREDMKRPTSSTEVTRTQPESRPESQPESRPESLLDRTLNMLRKEPLSKAELSLRLGHKQISGQLNVVIRDLLKKDLAERTIPDKPTSSKQKYRLTEKGKRHLKAQ